MAELLPVLALILVSGLLLNLLARRLQVPSVIFYLIAGLLLGETALGIITPETFGEGLEIVVGISVAIIVFDGAFALRRDRLKEASTSALRLVTIGAVVTLLGVAGSIYYLEDTGWEIALVAGALLVATGPTVITPIFEVVRVREHVSAALETEGIVNDVTAAIAAVVFFETVLLDDLPAGEVLIEFLTRFGVGIGAGVLAAIVIYLLLEADISPGSEIQAAQFLILAAAVGSFALAESVATEAGIAAAATSGVILGNLDLDHHEEIEEFGRNATLIVLSFVFISLAALIDLGTVRALGVEGILLVLVAMLVIRPLVAFIATVNIERYTLSERLFVGAIGPRGIIPASVATLFAIELRNDGLGPEADILLGTVFVIIFATVAIEAGLAKQIASALGVTPMRTIIVGGGRVGRALARRLENRGEFVIVIESDDEQVERARSDGFTVIEGDGTETDVLREAEIDEAKMLIATTNDDDTNLLACQLATSKFDVESVFARVNQPNNIDAFDTLGVTAIDDPTATALTIDNEIERPHLAHWMNEIGDGHDVQEVTVTAEHLFGKTVSSINAEIPDGCFVGLVTHDDETHVPDPDHVIERGDSITFIGDSDAVEAAMKDVHPHD